LETHQFALAYSSLSLAFLQRIRMLAPANPDQGVIGGKELGP
jgi:hypothetical protein